MTTAAAATFADLPGEPITAEWIAEVQAMIDTAKAHIAEANRIMDKAGVPRQPGRDEKATIIAASGQIRRNGTGWYVESQSQPNTFYWTDGTRCTCGDWKNRQPAGGCKHMRALALHLAEREALKAQAERDIRDIWG